MTTREEINARTASIQERIKRISAAADAYAQSSLENVDKGPAAALGSQNALLEEMGKLQREVRGPMASIFESLENCRITALRALLEMGVFDALPPNGDSVTADELVEKLKVDKILLIRLMRNVTATGPLSEVDEETYAHTPASLSFLWPQLRAAFSHMMDDLLPSMIFLCEFLRKTDWKNPVDPLDNPYTYGHRTGGKGVWEYMSMSPDRLNNFNTAMTAYNAANIGAVDAYPFAEKLRERASEEDTTLLVDIGGGKGHMIQKIRGLCPDVKGRMVLQDRQEAIKDAFETEGVDNMVHDFFTPQPVKGARIYYIRRCLHDWPDSTCIEILKNIVPAMNPETSRLVIAEHVLPNKGVSAESAFMDHCMLMMTGCERSEKQWHALLSEAGLTIENFHKLPSTNMSAIEASVIR